MSQNKEVTILKKNIESIWLDCFNSPSLRFYEIEDDINFYGFKYINYINYKLGLDRIKYDSAVIVIGEKKIYWFYKVSTVLNILNSILKV